MSSAKKHPCSKTQTVFTLSHNFTSLNIETKSIMCCEPNGKCGLLIVVRELILVMSAPRNESLTREQITRTANNNSKASANQPYLYVISGCACGRRECWLISVINTHTDITAASDKLVVSCDYQLFARARRYLIGHWVTANNVDEPSVASTATATAISTSLMTVDTLILRALGENIALEVFLVTVFYRSYSDRWLSAVFKIDTLSFLETFQPCPCSSPRIKFEQYLQVFSTNGLDEISQLCSVSGPLRNCNNL